MEANASRTMAFTPESVASIMFNPVRDPEWIGGADRVEEQAGDPTSVGARVTRHGGFLGRKFSWQTEVEDFEPNRLLRMRFVEGPMKGGEVSYHIAPDGDGSRVSIRNTGPGPQIMSWFVKRSVGKDLDRLAMLIGKVSLCEPGSGQGRSSP
jgi:uncharacterized protein YndB with AHSA1/START domain